MAKRRSTVDLSAYEATRAAVAADPSTGLASFTTVTTWEEGARARTTARSFTLQTDEPTVLGGTDAAVDPMELVLAAVGTCITVGWVTHAVQRGIEYRSLEVQVTGSYDMRGYLGLGGDARPGFQSIEYTVRVDSDAPPETLEEIRAGVEATSPMFDNVKNATPLRGWVEGGT
ncbi:MAG: OsmC family protein [Actinomycetota bacterium]